MFDFYEKRRLRKYLYSKPVLLLLVGIVILLSMAVWNIFTKELQTAEKKEQRQAALAELKQREQGLQEEIERLKTRRGVEEEIRDRFDVAKEGEDVIVIVDREESGTQTKEVEDESMFRSVLDFFGL